MVDQLMPNSIQTFGMSPQYCHDQNQDSVTPTFVTLATETFYAGNSYTLRCQCRRLENNYYTYYFPDNGIQTHFSNGIVSLLGC